MTPQFKASIARYLQKRKEEKSALHKYFKKIYRKILGRNIKHNRYYIIGGYK